MGDSDKSRRRAGDDTRARVDDLAGGWNLPELADQPATRPDTRESLPDSPTPPTATGTPGPSPAMRPAPPARTKPASAPPPVPPARAKPASVPPPTPAPAPAPVPARPRRGDSPTSVGERTGRDVPRFDSASLRADTAGADVIDTAPAVAPVPDADGPAERDDATRIDPRVPDATRMVRPGGGHGSTGSVRALASLPRRRGLGGDVRYVATVSLGVTRARRELARLDQELDGLRANRTRRLIAVAADALGDDAVEHPALAEAGDRLAAIEDQRAKEAGAAAAADARADAARRDHEGDKKRLEDEVAAIEAELAELATTLAPLEKDAAAARKRAADLRATLDRIEGKIAATEARKVSVKGQRGDQAAIDAELATLRADRIAVGRDEPALAAELDELLPRIAALEARRADARTRLDRARADLVAIGEELQERLRVVEASKKVIDRALAGIATERDRALAELGERLALDRPAALARPLRDVDEVDLSIATGERRAMELREVLGSVDRGAVARGLALLLLVAAALGAFVWFLASR